MTIGGALLAALILGVFAYLIADSQSQDREDVEKRFQDVAQVSGAGHERDLPVRLPGDADCRRRRTSPARSSQDALVEFAQQGQSQYVAVYDEQRTPARRDTGRADSRARPSTIALETGQAAALRRHGDRQGRDDRVRDPLRDAVRTTDLRHGLAARSRSPTSSPLRSASCRDFADAETVMVDSNGIVLGGDNLSSPVGREARRPRAARGARRARLRRLRRRPLLRLERDHQLAVQDRPRRVQGRALREHQRPRRCSWIIFAAFALALFGGLFLLRRALADRRRARAARAERAPRGRDQRQHHPGARAGEVPAAGGRGRGERGPGLRDAARGAAARVGPARRRRGAGRPAAARDRRRDDAARSPRRPRSSHETADLSRRLRRRAGAAAPRAARCSRRTARWRWSARPSDGREAIEVIERLQPDVVVLDLSMPELDGLEAIPLIHQVAPAAEIVRLLGFRGGQGGRGRAAAEGQPLRAQGSAARGAAHRGAGAGRGRA